MLLQNKEKRKSDLLFFLSFIMPISRAHVCVRKLFFRTKIRFEEI